MAGETVGTRSTTRALAEPSRWRICLVLGTVAVLGAILFALDPARTSVFPPCPFHALTGLHCPGCGALRAAHQVLHGHVLRAMDLNALAVLAMPLLAWQLASTARCAVTGRRGTAVFVPPAWIWASLGLVVLFGVLRNIPLEPFCVLAP